MIQNLTELKGLGPKRLQALKELGIESLEDLLFYAPASFKDYSKTSSVCDLKHGQDALVSVVPDGQPKVSYFRGISLTHLSCRDQTGNIRLKWFNQPYRAQALKNTNALLCGGIVSSKGGLSMISPVIYDHIPGLLPVYALQNKVSQTLFRQWVREALSKVSLEDPLPPEWCRQFSLLTINEAVSALHAPASPQQYRAAQRRLAFERTYYYLQSLKASPYSSKGTGLPYRTEGLAERFTAMLPFAPTNSQVQVMGEISKDLRSPAPMNRLLQGDVGSGKTVIALFSMFAAAENGYQSVLLAPTEILARQHAESIRAILGEEAACLTGSLRAKERRLLLEQVRTGQLRYIVGTHALLEDRVEFRHLGLVVTDEQHRFGVRQRSVLLDRPVPPDVLVMTATPIPRTISLLVFQDLKLSVLRDLPPGRLPIKTSIVPNGKREAMYQYVSEQAARGIQTYVVCPFVEESECSCGRSSEEIFEEIKALQPDLSVGLLHGRMRGDIKDDILERFRSGEIKVLVSTTVIEVGIHVTNACIMIIEGADRFGLAQLHQLRGRVGRGSRQSYCFLLTDSENDASLQRLKYLTETNDGFTIAEKDLELRGPGEIFGTKQHGVNAFLQGLDYSTIQQASDAVRRYDALPSEQKETLLKGGNRYLRKGYVLMN